MIPAAPSPDVAASTDIRRRTIFGIRSVLVLNFAALPLSFVTNMVFGRISPEALGAYGAIQLLVGSCFVFVVFGGANVFTRFVPALDEEDRIPFLLSYGAVVAVIFAGIAAFAFGFPAATLAILESFGSPPTSLALALLAVCAVSGFSCWYLYASSEPTAAAVSEKLVVVGFFATALLALGFARGSLASGDMRFLWSAALVVYLVSAGVAVWRVTRTPSFAARRLRWLLPREFWSVGGYTHVETLVSYVYFALAPTLVLFWVDLEALGYLHAALRYVVLLNAIPAALISVMAPEMRRLVAVGEREASLRQASTAIRISLLALAPATLAFIAFAEDAMGVFGPQFREHADVLRLVAPTILAAPVVLCGAGAALAVGAFAAYLRASMVYVVLAIGLIAILVPMWGVPGAAAATSLGALVRQVAVEASLRRDGFHSPPRLRAAWLCAATGLAIALWIEPSRAESAGLFAVLLAAFAVLGKVRAEELRRVLRMGLRGTG